MKIETPLPENERPSAGYRRWVKRTTARTTRRYARRYLLNELAEMNAGRKRP